MQNIPKVGGGGSATLPLSTVNVDVQFSTRPDTPRSPFIRQSNTNWAQGGFWEQDYAFLVSGNSISFSAGVWTLNYASYVISGEEAVNYVSYTASVTASSASLPITGWTVTLSDPNGAGVPTISEYTNTTIPLTATSISIKGLWNPDTGYGPRTQTLTGSGNGYWSNGSTNIQFVAGSWTLSALDYDQENSQEFLTGWASHASAPSSSLPRFGWSRLRGEGYLRIT